MPRFWHAVDSSLRMSRLNGVASTTSHVVTFESNSANPSWCLDVITMYFMPASCAICTQASGSNFTGFHCFASCSYSATGIRARFMIHSPMPGTYRPFHSPAGMAYRPQWMKRPNLASRNQASRACFAAGESASGACGAPCAMGAESASVRPRSGRIRERVMAESYVESPAGSGGWR